MREKRKEQKKKHKPKRIKFHVNLRTLTKKTETISVIIFTQKTMKIRKIKSINN